MSKGYLLVDREIFNHSLWLAEKPVHKSEAWIDLLNLTNYADGTILVSGTVIEVKRGQCSWSQERLAERWGWSRGKVIRFLDVLKMVQWIDIKTVQCSTKRKTLIEVKNYEIKKPNGTTDSTTDSTTNGTDKNKVNKKDIYEREFQEFWDTFGDKRGVAAARKAYIKARQAGAEHIDILRGAEKYKAARGADRKYWKQAKGWLNDNRWLDEHEPVAKQTFEERKKQAEKFGV